MRVYATWIAVVLALSAASPASADRPAPDAVSVDDVRYAGSGCPAGSVHVALSPDRTAFSLLFDAFTAALGPDATVPRKRKCQIHVTLRVPDGWAYAVDAVDFRGFAFLDAGVVATQTSYVHIAAGGRTAPLAMVLTGALWLDYLHSVVLDDADLAWSGCGRGRNLFIRTTVELERGDGAADAQGVMVVDSADGRVRHDYRVRWQRCSP